jgi:lysophospholipase L1-like esterase
LHFYFFFTFSCNESGLYELEEATDDTSTTPDPKPRGSIVMLGDSVFALSGDIAKELKLLSGKEYPHYYIVGAEMKGTKDSFGGTESDLPNQYKRAKAEHAPIHTIIFDGGANDIILTAYGQCKAAPNPENLDMKTLCRPFFEEAVEEVTTGLSALLKTMREDGVQHVIYQGYYRSTNPDFDDASDFGMQALKAVIDEHQEAFQSPKSLSFIDPRPHFNGKEAEYIISDRIHPSAAGSKVLANLIWNILLEKGIETAP